MLFSTVLVYTINQTFVQVVGNNKWSVFSSRMIFTSVNTQLGKERKYMFLRG